MQKGTGNFRIKAEVYEWVQYVVLCLIVIVLIFTFVFRIVGVESYSMNDTLFDGDRLVISHLFYQPKQGDIVVITQPNSLNKPLIKRIIATENQTVDFDLTQGLVYVDGVVISESYIKEPTQTLGVQPMEFPYTVPEGCVFVMGDNRNMSTDSRSALIGPIDERYILGKALLRVFPLDKIGGLYGNMDYTSYQ